MKFGIMGGLLLGGLLSCALIGLQGIILIGLGAIYTLYVHYKEKQEEERQFHSHFYYPPYNY